MQLPFKSVRANAVFVSILIALFIYAMFALMLGAMSGP